MSRPLRLAWVQWVDSTAQGQRWKYESDVTNVPGLVSTVGWIVKEDRGCLTLASAIGDHSLSLPDHEREYGGLHTIVKSCIYRRRLLPNPEGAMARKKTKSAKILKRVGRELKKNPPAILKKTARKKGAAAAGRQRKAILLSKARSRGARIPKR